MELEPIRLVKFDIHGTEPLNKFEGEKHTLDKTCPWIIPNGSPFFADLTMVTLYDERGAELKRDRDYFVQGEFTPFCAATGQSICSFIELSPDTLRDNAFVKTDYQSLGAYFVPRSNLQEWLDLIRKGVTPIDWSKVWGVPATLPPELHTHSIKTEIADWYELTWFYAYLEKILGQRNPTANDDITRVVEEVYGKLLETKRSRLAALVAHDSNYHVPHGTNKFDILLGNHDNFPTATLPEQIAGLRADALSTPMGVSELAKTYKVDTSAAMLQGIIPVSRFGGDSFIPPNISGSFEGMGQQTECSGICLEPSGLLMLLSNHYDGRTKGLYFSTVENYNKDNINITYTNYKYRPPVLASMGIDVDRIVAGSGNKVIMTGVTGTNDWFVALTNNTFDPGAHSYVRCDMSAITAVFGSPYGNSPVFGWNDQATIHLMGQYIVLIQFRSEGGIPKARFYRVLTEDVRSGRPVKWEALPLTYVDYDGTQFTNVLDYVGQTPVTNASGQITKFGRLTPIPYIDWSTVLRRNLNLSWPKSGSGQDHYLHFHSFSHNSYANASAPSPIGNILGVFSEMVYIFNPVTGSMVLQAKAPPITLNFANPTDADNTGGTVGYNFLSTNLLAFQQPASVVLPTGELACGYINEGQSEFPVNFQLIKFQGVTSGEGLLSQRLNDTILGVERTRGTIPTVVPATKNGVYSGCLTFEADGELFKAIDQTNPNLRRQMYFRKVSGAYAIREGVNNLQLGNNIYSRPLTTEIYKAINLDISDATMGITGTAAECAAAGVEMGSGSLSFCAWSTAYVVSEHLPANRALRAPASGNVLMSFPRTYTKSLDVINKEATFTPTSFYGLRQAVIDQLKAYTGGASRWAFTIYHLGDEAGGMFRGLNISLITINWIVEGNKTYRSQVLAARPIVEAPNADHPGVYLITGFTILHAPANVLVTSQFVYEVYTQFTRLDDIYLMKPYMTAYRNGNYLKVLSVSGHAHVPYATQNTIQAIFDLNIASNQIETLAVGSVSRAYGDTAVMWPNVGMTDVTLVSNSPETTSITPPVIGPYQYTGGAAGIFFKTGAGYIVPTSVYPETGWVLFLQENIKMMVNGTPYIMGGGTIDLRDIDVAPQNKTFYVYVTVEDDKPKYVISTNQLRKSGNLMKAATVVTNDRQILTITRHQPLFIGGYMLSYTREGGIIPLSTGFPQDEGDFIFLHQAELLP